MLRLPMILFLCFGVYVLVEMVGFDEPDGSVFALIGVLLFVFYECLKPTHPSQTRHGSIKERIKRAEKAKREWRRNNL